MRSVDKSMVPAVTVPRLALYLRKLRELQARGVQTVSSKELAERIDLNAAQIRKDFSYFGEFGVRGVGYDVPRLIGEITKSLGLNRSWNVIIVGAGLLGTALARYKGFSEQGFRLVGMFDSSPKVVGKSYGQGKVRDIAELEAFARRRDRRHRHHHRPCPRRPGHHRPRGGADGRGHGRAQLRSGARSSPQRTSIVRQVDLSSELMFLSFYLDRERG